MNIQLRITNLINKIAEYTKISDAQKNELIKRINEGLFYNIISDAKDIVNQETFKKLDLLNDKSDPKALEVIYIEILNELSNTEQGQKAIIDRLFEVLEVITNPIKDSLSQDQKNELIRILEND